MEDRRCRKLMVLIMSTVIILGTSVQSTIAAPEKSTDQLLLKVKNFQETVFSLANVEDNRVLNYCLAKLSGKGIGEKKFIAKQRESLENEIVFVLEQPPLAKVQSRQWTAAAGNETGGRQENYSRSVSAETLRDDLEIMARIIYAEARGESFEGQVAVGAVVLNRVQHPEFPRTIREVIYQPGQFTAVEDKQIELTPNERAYQAAQAALEGFDPSNGAIYYYNPKTATDRWIRTRSVIRNIGNHRFCV